MVITQRPKTASKSASGRPKKCSWHGVPKYRKIPQNPTVPRTPGFSPKPISGIKPELDAHSWASGAWKALMRALYRSPFPVARTPQDREIFLNLYEKRCTEGTAIKWLKFHTSFAFAYAVAQTELPTPPGPFADGERPGEFCANSVGKIIRKIMKVGLCGSWLARRCAYDILMSKIGDPVAPSSFVSQSLVDHRKALTRTEAPWDLDPQDRYTLSRVKDEIRQICRKVYGGRYFRNGDHIPSMHASFLSGVADAGGFGELMRSFELPKTLHSDSLVGMVSNPKDGVKEVRFIDAEEDVRLFQSFVDSEWIRELPNKLHASPVGILEPLKVRIITKGQAAEYYRAIELQKYLHSNLKRHPVFQYIGHPIDDESWVQAFGRREDLKEDEFYVSGDYKAATDNLRSELSEFTWRMIAESTLCDWQGRVATLAETPYFLLGTKCLTKHRLHYGHGADEVVVDQTWGQLMGSPMSFPILCIVNAAASLVSIGQHLRKCTRMRVNGDDIGFIANKVSYATWKYVTKVCGLEFSLGKNYTSRDFLIMNSELRRPPKQAAGDGTIRVPVSERVFDADLNVWKEVVHFETRQRPWKLEGFLNQSVIYGTVKKGMDAGSKKDLLWTDLESLSHEALRGIPDSYQERMLHKFLSAQREVIQTLPGGCNLFFPRDLGGAGVAVPAGRTIEDMAKSSFSGRAEKPIICLYADEMSQLCPNHDELDRSRKIAAYLACNNRARLGKRPTPQRALFGDVRSMFKEIQKISDSQVPRMLRPKPLRREQHTMLGGTTMLGYLIRGLSGRSIDGGQVPDSSVGMTRTTAMIAGALNRDYFRWSFPALHCPLEPMSWSKLSGYQDHLELRSYIEFMKDVTVSRTMNDGRDNTVLCT